MNVHVLYEYGIEGRPHGASYIRLLLPLGHPALGSEVTVQFGMEYKPCDVLVIDRTWSPWITMSRAEMLIKDARRDGCRILFAIDDNLLDFDLYNLHRRHFSPEQMRCVRYFAREADAILTSTPRLRERLLSLNPDVRVVPNALDERMFPDVLPETTGWAGKVTIGYMGTFTHEADLYMILEPLRQFLRERRESVNFQILGVSAEAGLELAFAGLPMQFLRAEHTSEYPPFVRWMLENVRWDIGVAPLVNNPFTRCKSDIKFLDYSLMGIPGIYSDVESYALTVRDGETGLLADETPEAWYRALVRLTDDAALRASVRRKAYDHVRQNRVLEHTAQLWLNVLLDTAAKKQGGST